MPIALAIVAALLVMIGSAAYFFFDITLALLVTGGALVSRRILGQICWILFILPLMPGSWRHALVELMRRFRTWRKDAWEDVETSWRGGTLFVRLLIVLGVALGSGVLAGAIIFAPGNIRRIPGIGTWLSEVVMPYLMRTATARSVEAYIPRAWKKIPARVRAFMWRPFRFLWWRTARYGLRTRQMYGKHHKHKQHIT